MGYPPRSISDQPNKERSTASDLCKTDGQYLQLTRFYRFRIICEHSPPEIYDVQVASSTPESFLKVRYYVFAKIVALRMHVFKCGGNKNRDRAPHNLISQVLDSCISLPKRSCNSLKFVRARAYSRKRQRLPRSRDNPCRSNAADGERGPIAVMLASILEVNLRSEFDGSKPAIPVGGLDRRGR
jgi:hypothetical protein